MRLFAARSIPEHREIDKNAPPKTGAALFFDVFGREWWELAKLNLMIVIFSLPLITIPATIVAAMRITTTMIRDENHYLWRDFWETFRAEFVRASLLGWVTMAGAALGVAAVVMYGRAIGDEPLLATAAVISAFGTLLVVLIGSHIATMLVLTDLATIQIIKNACLLAVVWFIPGLVGVFVCAAIWILHIVAYPISVFIPATFGFSFCVFVMTFQSQRALMKYVVRPSTPKFGGGDILK